ncbi:hypothetical protein BU25DRAFT_481306 [Macroventuria anomochaeta]|uniref:Uncharacterized protein n=1 Tax=Macroventuria anomochaeta TaxID=301207 RepID=A0ACB6RJ25_9PLEO|nr:uncharacterized protein BU25DRAFT_481306 [Macroventuria anomochaeta]KAF2621996.1 hypothetical protein BU25DRAFT_481306 [Macroventuria anomochaeta]
MGERGMYVKEHVNWMVTAEVESTFLHPSFSPLNITSLEANETDEKPENPTVVPAELWTRVRLTLLIRHPALTFPSALRTAVDNEGLEKVLREESKVVMRCECTVDWHVLLYRFLGSFHPPSGSKGKISAESIILEASQLQDSVFVRR